MFKGNIIWQRFCRKIHTIWKRTCVKLFLLYSYFSSSDSYFFPTFFSKLVLLFSYFFIKGHFQACHLLLYFCNGLLLVQNWQYRDIWSTHLCCCWFCLLICQFIPSISLCPGIQTIFTSFPLPETLYMLSLMLMTVSILQHGKCPPNAVFMAD